MLLCNVQTNFSEIYFVHQINILRDFKNGARFHRCQLFRARVCVYVSRKFIQIYVDRFLKRRYLKTLPSTVIKH